MNGLAKYLGTKICLILYGIYNHLSCIQPVTIFMSFALRYLSLKAKKPSKNLTRCLVGLTYIPALFYLVSKGLLQTVYQKNDRFLCFSAFWGHRVPLNPKSCIRTLRGNSLKSVGTGKKWLNLISVFQVLYFNCSTVPDVTSDSSILIILNSSIWEVSTLSNTTVEDQGISCRYLEENASITKKGYSFRDQ